ncbi:hypothetical protein SynPROS91_01136 [Synechococcus sp. PROS-9-1]|uniref:hypothetical protein n=1 Tax=Synechococcus sp. PROS-9-1 TaxID=1968775 RepID=UPI001645381A|nr:hypothetical protein [Synechococcus sp. PROS-9-1]QNJ31514.1 hypothetical protein SynPROS91_01136 [Synechococcus sp. PROS-9-1]
MNYKKWKLQHLLEYLQDLQDTRASQHTALLEFRYGDYYNPEPEHLKWAMSYTRQHIGQDINDLMCEIERREPGTFTTYAK